MTKSDLDKLVYYQRHFLPRKHPDSVGRGTPTLGVLLHTYVAICAQLFGGSPFEAFNGWSQEHELQVYEFLISQVPDAEDHP